MVHRTCSRLLTAAFVAGLVLPAAADAQVQIERDFLTGVRTGVGYAGSMPDILLGASVFHLFSDGGFGLVADFKMGHETIKGDPSYVDEWTTEYVQENRDDLMVGPRSGERSNRNDEWTVINVGIMRPVTPEFALALGAGAAHRTGIDEFLTEDHDVAPTEWYWVQNEEVTGWNVNLHGSVFFRAGSNIVLRFGYDRAPRMLSFGGYWTLSR